MKKHLFTAMLMAGIFLSAFGQEETVEETKEKKFDHYASVQVNQLLKQLFSLNNSATVQSPYFLNYAINSVNSGYGLNTGFGYYYFETKEGNDLNSTETSNENLSFRIGVEQKFQIGKKWLASGGLDVVSSNDKSNSISTVRNAFGDFFTVENDVTTKSFGGGIRGNINFLISNRILIGTEASYYYTKNKMSKFSKEDNNGQVTESEDSPESKSITFNFPVVVWLSVKF